MKAAIITIGNSKGVRIPKPLLEESGLTQHGKYIEIKAKPGEIKLVAIKRPKRRKTLDEEYVLSLSSLSDWDTAEEDAAWAYLQ